MARLPEELIDRIKAEVPLVDLCREYGIELTGHAKNLMGKSPFREEAEPSFIVTPSKTSGTSRARAARAETTSGW